MDNVKTSFCYEIHEDAKMAHDIETNDSAKAYVKLDIDVEKNEEEYQMLHNDLIKRIISEQLDISVEYLKPITLKYYLNHYE